MRKALCALFASATIGLALAAATPAMASSTCPPSDAVWTNNAKYTGQPYPHAVGNLDGYDYYLNNDQWNEQSTSNLSRSAVRLRLMCDRVASLDA
jgi:hypothetical protein